MVLGEYCIGLNVKNIQSSLKFYELLGFSILDGGFMNNEFPDTEHTKWLILDNGHTRICLFQGYFSDNVITFNPLNVLEVQESLKNHGLPFVKEVDLDNPKERKLAIICDPDGNQIMFDQKINRSKDLFLNIDP